MSLTDTFCKKHLKDSIELKSKVKGCRIFKNANTYHFISDANHGGIINEELKSFFKTTSPENSKNIFISLLRSRSDFLKIKDMPAWDTYVWFAEEPDHSIYFNGSKLTVYH